MPEVIRIFYGEDRVGARKMIERQLGVGYEVIEAEGMQSDDMASIFLGTSIFGDERAILIKDLSDNKACWDLLPNFVDDCSHNVVIWENKLDKRSACYKVLSKNKKVEFKEFRLAENPNKKLVFDIFDTAMRGDGGAALKMCEKIEDTNEPYMFMGLMTTQAIKKLQGNNSQAVRAMKILARADIDMKTTGLEPWTVIKMALLKISKK